MLRPSVENNLSVLIKKRRYSAALHNVAVIHAPVVARPAAFRTNFPAPAAKKKQLRSFSVRSRWCYCDKIIADLAVAFLLVVSSFHLPAARVPGRDRLRPARRLVAVAAVAAVVAVAAGAGARAPAAERERPAFFLVGRALRPQILHQTEARPADEIRTVDLRHVARVQLRQ